MNIYSKESIAKQMASKAAKKHGGTFTARQVEGGWIIEKVEQPVETQTVETVSESNAFGEQPVEQPTPETPAEQPEPEEVEITLRGCRETPEYITFGKRWLAKNKMRRFTVAEDGTAVIVLTPAQQKSWKLSA